MCLRSDEMILYECYQKIADTLAAKVKSVPLVNDQKAISGIKTSVARLLHYLDEAEMLSGAELQKRVISAKGIYVQVTQIKARNPECVSKLLTKDIDRLIKAVSKHEASMIGVLRMQEIGGERIDIEEIFDKKANLNRLGNTLARDVVKDAINDISNMIGKKNEEDLFYISETGKRYHLKNCPYCKGRVLAAATKAMIANQKLTPCRCISIAEEAAKADRSHITAFIDESIHPIKWTESGEEGQTGSFSYIICWGNITGEGEIQTERIIATGVDYMKETDHIEHLTEAAIGKVMVMLAYDYNFSGALQIYTDNLSTVQKWTSGAKNSKLAEQFDSVTVSFIPREQNVKADQLGRTKMYFCVPTNVYNMIVHKCDTFDQLKKGIDMIKM